MSKKDNGDQEQPKTLDWQLTVAGLQDIRDGNVESGIEALKMAREIQEQAENNKKK